MNKKGIELTVNFLVLMIIAVVVVIMSLFLFKNILGSGEDLTDTVTKDVEQRMNELLLKSDEVVMIPQFQADARTGKVHKFALGIKSETSQCGGGSEANYDVDVEFVIATDATNNDATLTPGLREQARTWYFDQTQTYTIKNGERMVIGVPIMAGNGASRDWTYGFDVIVSCNGREYGGLQKVYITVV